ncbi:MAG: YaeQ family protein [Betaproteobacteria bacterium]
MALKATIFRAELGIADMERNYYATHALTLARHPSENDERMMVRLLAFALNAHEALAFGASIGSDDEPDLWRKDLTGAIQLWVDVGLPDEKRIRRACGRSRRVVVYSYGRGADLWWKQSSESLARSGNLDVIDLPQAATQAMAKLADRNMKLDCTIQDGQVWLASERDSVAVEATSRLRASARA